MAIPYTPETKARIDAAKMALNIKYQEARDAYDAGLTHAYQDLRAEAEDMRQTLITMMRQGHLEGMEALASATLKEDGQTFLGADTDCNEYGTYVGSAAGLSIKPDGVTYLTRYHWHQNSSRWLPASSFRLTRLEAGALLAALMEHQTS